MLIWAGPSFKWLGVKNVWMKNKMVKHLQGYPRWKEQIIFKLETWASKLQVLLILCIYRSFKSNVDLHL